MTTGADPSDMSPPPLFTRSATRKIAFLRVLKTVLEIPDDDLLFNETNGKASSGKRTKHINIRYFFITDRVNKGELSVVWCPTGDMIGNFATKPLQGALFRKFRDQIMGVMPAMDPGLGKSKPPASNKRKGKK